MAKQQSQRDVCLFVITPPKCCWLLIYLWWGAWLPCLHFQTTVSPRLAHRFLALSHARASFSSAAPQPPGRHGNRWETYVEGEGWREKEGQRGTERKREREGGDMKRLVCYHMTTPHPLLTSNPPKPTPTAPHFNAEPLTQNNCPSTQTHSGPPYTYLCLPRILLSPIILLSIPLLSRQAARMAGMETFTDGSTGKFSHPQKQKEKRKLF